ncbi:MAG: hypothetical protein R6V36_08700 [Psychroflexus sp.]
MNQDIVEESHRMSKEEQEQDNKEEEIEFLRGNIPIITISEKNGIVIHRENHPDFTPDDFVNEFLSILEELITVKFEKNGARIRIPHSKRSIND